MKKAEKSKINLEFLKKILDIKDFECILEFSAKVIISGFTLNLAALIFGIPFNIWNIISLGSLLWLLDSKFVPLLRRLWFRR